MRFIFHLPLSLSLILWLSLSPFLSIFLFSVRVSRSAYSFCLPEPRKQSCRKVWLIITEYTKLRHRGSEREKENTISLPFDVRHERDQNYKETERCEEEWKRAHSSQILCSYCFVSVCVFPSFFLFSFLFQALVYYVLVLKTSVSVCDLDYGDWLIMKWIKCSQLMTSVFPVDVRASHKINARARQNSVCHQKALRRVTQRKVPGVKGVSLAVLEPENPPRTPTTLNSLEKLQNTNYQAVFLFISYVPRVS